MNRFHSSALSTEHGPYEGVVEGDSNAKGFAVSSEVIIDSSHAIQIEVCGFAVKPSRTPWS